MKKHNLLNRKFLLKELPVLFCLISLLSCKTVPFGKSVTAVDLLDNNSDFYISIPKNADEVLLKQLLINNLSGLSEKNLEKITNRINKVYIGVSKNQRDTSFQLGIDANIPKQLIPNLLSSKNGWNKREYISKTNKNIKYSVYNNKSMDVTFPNSNIACMGRNVDSMLDNYEKNISLAGLFEAPDAEMLNNTAKNYLSEDNSEVRFFSSNPQSFIQMITGIKMDLKILEVFGSFKEDSENKDLYVFKINFGFSNEKYLKASKALLKLAFGITNSDLNILENNTLSVVNFRISKEQISKLFVL